MKNQSNHKTDVVSVRYDVGYLPVKYYLKQLCPKDRPSQIVLSTFVQGKRIRVFTKMKVEPVFWEKSGQRCLDSELQCTRVRKRVQKINTNLDRIVSEIDYQDKLMAEKGKFLNIDNLRSSIAKVMKQESGTGKDDPITTLKKLATSYSDRLNDKGRIGAQSSVRTYLMALTRLENFVEETGFKLYDFSCFDNMFYEKFKEYLINYKFRRKGQYLKYTSNTVLNTVGVINNLTHKAYLMNLSGGQYFKASCSIRHETAVKIYLSERELAKLGRVKVDSASEERVRDMFIITSFTALRISDINSLNDALFADETITLPQRKTNNPVCIPILKEISHIVDKYRAEGFPEINSTFANSCIKDLARRAGIDEDVLIPEIRGGVKQFKKVPKYTQISFHTARRSCITNLYKRGYSSNYLMSLSGHKSLASFQNYIKSDASEMSKEFIRELKRKKDI